eukprot:5197353-Prymnesium_polylepis.1
MRCVRGGSIGCSRWVPFCFSGWAPASFSGRGGPGLGGRLSVQVQADYRFTYFYSILAGVARGG